MAYISQDRKAELAPAIKAALKKYKVSGTISINHYSTLVVNIRRGPLDFIGNSNRLDQERGHDLRPNYQAAKDSISVNPYWYQEHFDGEPLAFLKELMAAMNAGNHDNSDAMTDYFDVGWYTSINIGNWGKPYQLEAAK